ncbi:MAG: LD-carboxypeptidase [Proteobacteria bacterium]|nr:LD-carboxypeptidase [Pseudomonadota bacterium]
MQRRHCLSAALAAAVAGCATPPLAMPPPPPRRPPRLRPGDTIGLFAPSSRLQPEHVARALDAVRSLGFEPRLGRHVLAAQGHYAGSAEQRAEDFNALWRDGEVRALWALRGGAGAAALLPLLDWAALRADAKAVIGYSDLTALLLGLRAGAALVCFHGPSAVSRLTPFSAAALQAVLMQAQRETVLTRSPEHRRRAEAEPQFRERAIRAGVAEGPLIGGNLSVLAALVGTPWAADWRGALLCLEEVDEEPYRIDRLLTQLQQSQGLQRAAGLVGGVFERCEAGPDSTPMPLAEVLDRQFASAGVPAVYGYSFGHVRDQLTLPLGVRARLDTTAETLTLLAPAVD